MRSPCEALATLNNKKLVDKGKNIIVSLRLPGQQLTTPPWTRAPLAIDFGTLLWMLTVKNLIVFLFWLPSVFQQPKITCLLAYLCSLVNFIFFPPHVNAFSFPLRDPYFHIPLTFLVLFKCIKCFYFNKFIQKEVFIHIHKWRHIIYAINSR